jgi:hypothetical protein
MRPTSGRILVGIASAAAWATRMGSDLTLLATTRETTTGFFTKPRRKPPKPALADSAATPRDLLPPSEVAEGSGDLMSASEVVAFDGLLASDTTA